MYWFLGHTPVTGPLQNLYETVTNPIKNRFTDRLQNFQKETSTYPLRNCFMHFPTVTHPARNRYKTVTKIVI